MFEKGDSSNREYKWTAVAPFSKYLKVLKSWFGVPTTQMSMFILFLSAEALYEGAFSMWVP